MTVWRGKPAFLMEIAGYLRDLHRDAACQRQIALIVQQAQRRQMNRHERSRATRLDYHARPFEVELVSNPGRHEILIACYENLKRSAPIE